MAVNPYTLGARHKAVTPWSTVIPITGPGLGCDGLFSLYDSLGDFTAAKGNPIIGSYNVTTLLDGPEKVVRFGELEIGNGSTVTTFTASNRCKGLVVLCDKLTVKTNATLHMTGRGARVDRNDDPFFPFVDYKIPFKISLDSSRMSLAQALGIIRSQGLAPWDVGTFQHTIAGMFGFNLAVSLAGSVTLMQASGCGVGGSKTIGGGAGYAIGAAGSPGSNGGLGGGGTGGLYCGAQGSAYGITTRNGRTATPYGGGSGMGGLCSTGTYYWNLFPSAIEDYAPSYSGAGGVSVPFDFGGSTGGGAGNPGGAGNGGGNSGGNGVGGKLTIICRGTTTIESGGKIESNGMPGGSGGNVGGGGSGGGHVSIIAPAVPSNSGTIQAIGGAGGVGGGANGGAGGKGSVGNRADGGDKFLTFSEMGWV